MTLLLCLAVLLIWTIVIRFRRRRMYRLAALVPATKEDLPVIGVAHAFMGNSEDIMRTMQRYSYESMGYGGIVKLWLGHILYFIVTNPIDSEVILKTCLEKDDLHRFLRKLTGNGSVFAPVSIWRQRRKITVPVFSPKIVTSFVDVFSKQSEIMTKNLAHRTGKGQFSIWSYITRYSLDSIGDLKDFNNKSFLDLLISVSGGDKGFNDVELREEILVIVLAGTDTSSVCMGYTLQLLGKYPLIQEKVYEELLEIFGDSERPLVKDDLPKLKYLERVIKESLRLFPPAPFIVRKVLADTKLPSGRILPAGCGAWISIWGIHRDPKYWGPDAEAFDPDRFLPERFNLQHSCSYMPFSNGPRNCIGYQYATMSIKTALVAILRRYRVVLEPEPTNVPRIRVKLDIMMKAVEDYQVA